MRTKRHDTSDVCFARHWAASLFEMLHSAVAEVAHLASVVSMLPTPPTPIDRLHCSWHRHGAQLTFFFLVLPVFSWPLVPPLARIVIYLYTVTYITTINVEQHKMAVELLKNWNSMYLQKKKKKIGTQCSQMSWRATYYGRGRCEPGCMCTPL
jgi:hypothetical protein